MAVRQYIGARYVIKIYENSLDPSSAEWEAGVTYEPITLVTYNNSSYLSKKDVPGSVGDPAANPDYWIVTGAYNGQIAQLQNAVSDLQNNVSDLFAMIEVFTVDNRSDIANVNGKDGDIILTINSYVTDKVPSKWIVSTGTANGYTSIQLSNGKMAELIIENYIVHANTIGAFPNGSDCYPAIRKVLDDYAPIEIHFGVGRYTFNDRLWIESNQSMTGEGDATILYCAQDPPMDHGEFIGIIGISFNDVPENILLKDFAIDMYYLPGATEDVNPIGCTGARNLTIDGIHILRSNWRGINFDETYLLENIKVTRCTVDECYMNAFAMAHRNGGHITNVEISDCVFNNPGNIAAIHIYSDADAVLDIRGVLFKNISIKNIDVRAVYAYNTENIKFDGLYIESGFTGGNNIIALQKCANMTVRNCTIKGVAGDARLIGVLNSENVIITDNILDGSRFGVYVDYSVGDNVNLIVTSNIMINQSDTSLKQNQANLEGFAVGNILKGTTPYTNNSTSFKIIDS